MKELGKPEITKVSGAKLESKSLKTTIPREVVSLLGLKRGDKTEWKKILDEEGVLGRKGEILAIVRKVAKVGKT